MSVDPKASGMTAGGATAPRLMHQVHDAIRRRYFSPRTEEAYTYWIRQFIFFHGKRHPATLGEPEVTAFLNDLAARRKVAAATQNQALSALLFLYKEVMGKELPWLDGVVRPKRPVEPLRSHLARADALHRRDLAEGYGEARLPFALARKYPKAGR